MTEKPPSRWTELHEFCAAMRELMVVLAIVLLLVVPNAIRSMLERAGIRSVAGVEFDATTLAESQSELAKARSQMDQLRDQLALVNTLMAEPASPPPAAMAMAPMAGAEADNGPDLSSIPTEQTPEESPYHPRQMMVSRLLGEMTQKVDETNERLQRSAHLQDRAVGKVHLPPLEEIMRKQQQESPQASLPDPQPNY